MRRVLALLVLAAVAPADDIYGKQGDKPFASGVKVVSEGEKVVYIDKSLKERSFAKDMVGRIERKRSEVHDCLEKLDAAKDGDAFVAVAKWAEERKFAKAAVDSIYERALALDPKNAAANTALGRVLYKDEWMTPAQKAEREQMDAEADMAAKGLVRHGDEWVTPEDKAKLDQGLRKHDGRWMTEDEIKEAEGFVKHEGKWVKKEELEALKLLGPARKDTGLGDALVVAQTERFLVLGDLPPDQMNDLGATMERLYAEWRKLFPDADEKQLFGGSKYTLYAFKKSPPYQKLVRALFDRLKEDKTHSATWLQREEERSRARLRVTSFWDVLPLPHSAHVQMPDPYEGLKSHAAHFVANALATRHARLGFPTWWLNEGIGYYFEKQVTGSIQTFSTDVGVTKYAEQPGGEAKGDPWLDATQWNNLITQLVRTGRDPQLEQIKGKNLYEDKNKLAVQDLAKAHSVVTFLILDDPKKFAEFFKDAKTGSGSEVEREVAAVIKHYGSYGKIEERWKAYALNGFRLAR
ncbi:MAG: hypothetical protein L6Q95_18150 [Planctomycetes bacterium]|nr:hypothetical protein [Planctomycetota bacterium]